MLEAVIAGIALGYALGSVPSGLWIGWWVQGVDLRRSGSGRTGATNTLRRLGVKWSLLVFALDTGKAVLAVAIIQIAWDHPAAEAVTGLAAILGHIFPLYATFRGGRGATPAFGALLILAPWVGLAVLGVGAVLLAVTRIMSASVLMITTLAMLATIALAAVGEEPDAVAGFGVGAWAMIVVAHRDNLQRLRAGTEPRLGRTAPAPPSGRAGDAARTGRKGRAGP